MRAALRSLRKPGKKKIEIEKVKMKEHFWEITKLCNCKNVFDIVEIGKDK